MVLHFGQDITTASSALECLNVRDRFDRFEKLRRSSARGSLFLRLNRGGGRKDQRKGQTRTKEECLYDRLCFHNFIFRWRSGSFRLADLINSRWLGTAPPKLPKRHQPLQDCAKPCARKGEPLPKLVERNYSGCSN
jgi:hypothetical protein